MLVAPARAFLLLPIRKPAIASRRIATTPIPAAAPEDRPLWVGPGVCVFVAVPLGVVVAVAVAVTVAVTVAVAETV